MTGFWKRLRGAGRRDGHTYPATLPRPWERGGTPAEWPHDALVIRAPRARPKDATGPAQ